MDRGSILIAGFSGRALAQSARRAGFAPLVADAFGDEDTRMAAHAVEVLPHAMARGFHEHSLTDALDRLCASAPSVPLGLVLGAGFEGEADLVGALADRYRLLGCTPDTIRRAKEPAALAALLAELGIAHPEIRLSPPADSAGWLIKRQGGTGGTHIRRAPAKASKQNEYYYQREMTGTAVSALGIIGGSDCAFAFSRQWIAPSARRPFRFGGAVGSLELDPDLEARMIAAGLDVAKALSLTGLVSLDFLVGADNAPILLEVNPRPGATLDVFDDARGTLFLAQVAAGLGATTLGDLFAAWSPPAARAVAYLYADRAALRVPTVAWPGWALDRPRAGRVIGAGQPIATVAADGPDTAAAEALCLERLGTLERMLYEQATGKEAPQ